MPKQTLRQVGRDSLPHPPAATHVKFKTGPSRVSLSKWRCRARGAGPCLPPELSLNRGKVPALWEGMRPRSRTPGLATLEGVPAALCLDRRPPASLPELRLAHRDHQRLPAVTATEVCRGGGFLWLPEAPQWRRRRSFSAEMSLLDPFTFLRTGRLFRILVRRKRKNQKMITEKIRHTADSPRGPPGKQGAGGAGPARLARPPHPAMYAGGGGPCAGAGLTVGDPPSRRPRCLRRSSPSAAPLPGLRALGNVAGKRSRWAAEGGDKGTGEKAAARRRLYPASPARKQRPGRGGSAEPGPAAAFAAAPAAAPIPRRRSDPALSKTINF